MNDVTKAALTAAGKRHGLFDLDAVLLVDATAVTVDEHGVVQGADAAIAALRTAKPFLFARRAPQMERGEAGRFLRKLNADATAEQERRATAARGPLPTKQAKDMTPDERREALWILTGVRPARLTRSS
jgi:hypothetical protein